MLMKKKNLYMCTHACTYAHIYFKLAMNEILKKK